MKLNFILGQLLSVIVSFAFELSTANAADIDCDRSKTGAEKIICSDKNLTYYDKLLNVAYKRALQTAKNASVVKKKQAKWTSSRNSCKDAECMKDFYTQQLEWVSKQPRKSTYYKQVMSKDNKVCSIALTAFNQDIDKEYPQPSWNVTDSTTTLPRDHVPNSISPHWTESPQGWLANVDLDWDGITDSLIKNWSPIGLTFTGERMNGWLDVVNGYNPEFKEAEFSFTQTLYTLENQTINKPRKLNKSLYDQSYIDENNLEFIQANHFDVVIINGKAYSTFVSYDLPDGLFEDWRYRKWRVINRYTGSLDNQNDICYFVLARS